MAHAISSDRIFPTWIFHGPFGVGKSTLAHRFAISLLSGTIPQGDSLEIDPESETAKLVINRLHPDFFVLEQTEESIPLDRIRPLLLKIRKTPAMSKWRVLILENASKLNRNIHNSLLKILEDPPQRTVFIMISETLGTIPKTLLSRAAKVAFRPIPPAQVRKILENMEIEDAEKLSRLSDGSVGYALHLSRHNGVEIYEHLLRGFSSNGENYINTLKYAVANGLCDDFKIVRNSVLRILRTYVNMMTETTTEDCELEVKALRPRDNVSVDDEAARILEIISLMNRCESLMLDKNAVLMNVFERFFSGRLPCTPT